MATIAVTGSGSGIGAATREVLEERGDRVVGVDLKNADVEADLSTPDGRAAAIAATLEACGGVLDGVVTCAGIGGVIHPGPLVMSVNYFGTAVVLDGLREALSKGKAPAAVAISSNSTTIMPRLPPKLIQACLDGDEDAARAQGEKHEWAAYGGSKTAVAYWVRRNAVTDAWVGQGIRLNAVVPGRVRTALDDAQLASDALRSAVEGLPIPVGGPAQPEDIAHFIAFLLSDKGRFFCGSVLFQDGGTDAQFRAEDWPHGIDGDYPEALIPK